MPITGLEVINILRNVTGRIDANDPQFRDTTMLQYLNNFINLIMPQEVRLYENKTWYKFTLTTATPDPMPVNLQTLGLTTIGPPAYADGFELEWFQSPSLFFSKWPETQTYVEQRPVDVLYSNNELIFRGPPDKNYSIKISAYKVDPELSGSGGIIENDYFWRYVAYGAALDLFADYGELDNYNKYLVPFRRYKSLVTARTNQQLMSQRTYPTF